MSDQGSFSEFVRCTSAGEYMAPISADEEWEQVLSELLPYGDTTIHASRSPEPPGKVTYYRRKRRPRAAQEAGGTR